MPVYIDLRVDEQGDLIPLCDGQSLADSTPLTRLPSREVLQADSFIHGQALFAALGGAALLERLEADPERLLVLQCDSAAETVAWEFSTLPGQQWLATQYGLVRLVDRPTPALTDGGTLRFIALAADPLVDFEGNPRDGDRLNVEHELHVVRRTLEQSGQALQAQRVPPTKKALLAALRRGPAILHLTCHGHVIETTSGPVAALWLEDDTGGVDILRGSDLVQYARGVVRLAVLSACHTAEDQASLAQALVLSGVPVAIGMQGPFPDDQSDALAEALYGAVLDGLSVNEAMRQARLALLDHPDALGLPVMYVSRGAWGLLPLAAGQPIVDALGLPGDALLPPDVHPPRPLLGRNGELHALAKHYADGHKVVTVEGTGGIGKTALAAAFAERFAWCWPRGVRALSFASGVVEARTFRLDLLRVLMDDAEVQRLSSSPPTAQAAAVLDALREWDGLLVLDNYESVLQGVTEGIPEAVAVHQLVAQVANGGATLLLTSREQPAGLRGEVLLHSDGLKEAPAAELFLEHSTRAKTEEAKALARSIARSTEGYPLAIVLLAGEYDVSEGVNAEDYLSQWETELATASRAGLMGHHRTFTVAFQRSYARLTDDQQWRLRALSVYPFPFFVEAAGLVWQLPYEEDADKAVMRGYLGELSHRNLLEVDGHFDDLALATYRLQPALRQEVAHHVTTEEQVVLAAAYAAYETMVTEAVEEVFEVAFRIFNGQALYKNAATSNSERSETIRLLALLAEHPELLAGFDQLTTENSPLRPVFERLVPDPRKRAEVLAARPQLQAEEQRTQIEALINDTRWAARASLLGETRYGLSPDKLVARMRQGAMRAAKDEPEGSPWLEAAAFVRAVAALLAGEPPLPVPTAYAALYAELLQEAQSRRHHE